MALSPVSTSEKPGSPILRYVVRSHATSALVILQTENTAPSKSSQRSEVGHWSIDLTLGITCRLLVQEIFAPIDLNTLPGGQMVPRQPFALARVLEFDADVIGPLIKRDYATHLGARTVQSDICPPSDHMTDLLNYMMHAPPNGLCHSVLSEYLINDCSHVLATEGLGLPLSRRGARILTLNNLIALDRYMRTDPGKVNLEEMAVLCDLGPRQFLRTFRNTFGTTPVKFEQKARLLHARRQLREQERPLAHIAIDAGFHDQAHFTNAFRRTFGQTPGQYRRVTQR